jgi:hypothetical protein
LPQHPVGDLNGKCLDLGLKILIDQVCIKHAIPLERNDCFKSEIGEKTATENVPTLPAHPHLAMKHWPGSGIHDPAAHAVFPRASRRFSI